MHVIQVIQRGSHSSTRKVADQPNGLRHKSHPPLDRPTSGTAITVTQGPGSRHCLLPGSPGHNISATEYAEPVTREAICPGDFLHSLPLLTN